MPKKTIVSKWFVRNAAKVARELDEKDDKPGSHKRLYQRGLEARRRARGRHPRLHRSS